MIQAIRHYIRPAKSVRTLPALLLLPIIAAATSLALPTSAQAQVRFNGTRSTVSSGYNQPTGIAVDSGGNVYEIVFGGNQQLKQTLQVNGTYVESQIASGLAFPTSIAIDASGNLYIPDQLHNQVVQLTPSGNTFTQTTLSANVGVAPTAIAIDAYGNLFVASAGNNSVYKETLSNGTYTQSTIVSQLNAAPNGIAVDTNNVVYIADTAGNQVLVETPSGDSSYTQTTLGTGLSAPAGIAVDYLGNVYIADGGNNRILKETLSGGIFIQSVLTTAVSNPAGVALDTGGNNLYVANNGGGNFIQLHLASVPFGSQAVAAPKTIAFPFVISAGTTLGSVSVLTTGVAGKDFTDAGSSTCIAQTYTDDTSCVINVAFTPLAAGFRRGAVVLADDTGNILAMVPIYGNGTGPQPAYLNTPTTLAVTGLSSPFGITTDAAGNIYIADPGASSVFKITPSGAQTTVGTDLQSPDAVVVDGAGNIYISDETTESVVKVTPAGVQTTVATGFFLPYNMAVDGSGNLYIADFQYGSIEIVSPSGVQSYLPTTFHFTAGLAFDAANNLYIAEAGTGKILKMSPAGVITTAASGLSQPFALALDPAGNIYISDSDGHVFQITPAGTKTLISGQQLITYGLAVDSVGNILYSDNITSLVYQIVRATPSALNFATTVVGATSTDSPQTTTLQNIGNAELDISAISFPADFPKTGSAGTDCSVSVPLLAADACTLTTSFKPAGPIPAGTSQLLSESISLTTNIPSAPVQSISVSGTEYLQPAAALPLISLASGTYNNTQYVGLGDTSPGAFIYYTLNGSTPTTRSTRYTGPIAVRNSYTLKVIASGPNYSYSPVASATYTLAVATPVVSSPGGTYETGPTVTISCDSTGATLVYTTNGSNPNANSLKYTGPITISATQTLKVLGFQTGYRSSPVVANTYYVQSPPATPQFSVPAGVYNNTQYVAITDSVPGVIIYYTLNGTTPTTASLKYTGPVAIRNSYTLNAIATAPGYSTVAPASAAYQLAVATPVVSLASGTYAGAQTVTITTGSTTARIHYTTNGLNPSGNSPTYTGPITIGTSQTLKVFATATGYTSSPVVANTYTIQ